MNDNWKKVIRLEIQQLTDYNTFIDKGLKQHMSNDYTKIRCCVIFTVKHNGQHKARFLQWTLNTTCNIKHILRCSVYMECLPNPTYC